MREDHRGGFLTGQMMYGRHDEFDRAVVPGPEPKAEASKPDVPVASNPNERTV